MAKRSRIPLVLNICIYPLLGLALALSSCGVGDLETGNKAAETEILWDRFGVPHIFAPDNRGLFKGMGWAQMRSHGNLILKLYGQARGRAAEYWGEEFLPSDRWVLTNGIPQRSNLWLASQEEEFRGYLEAFAEGINSYAQQHPDELEERWKVVLPVTAGDVLAHAQRTLHFTFVTSREGVEDLERRWTGGRQARLSSAPGSNAWAVAPSRSQSGNALLLANPHLPWDDLFLFYEAHVVSPDIDSYGACLVGSPILQIAFNDDLGWTHTVNTHDGADFYQLTLQEDGYLWDGETKPFQAQTHRIAVRQEDGSQRQESLTVKRSIHGPLVAETAGKALAMRVVGLEDHGVLQAWWDMNRARNLEEFESVLRRLQIPMFTVMYADGDGNILHLFGGRTPVRPDCECDWAGIVPGQGAATLWTETHGYDELPRLLNPASGWLQNANDPPWTTTLGDSIDPDRYPDYMAPRFMHFRAQHSARLLAEDESISLQEMIEYKHSTRIESADRILDDLIPAARRQGGELARRAAEVLEKWDRRTDAESRGAVLFRAFYRSVGRRLFAQPWSQHRPLQTPNGLADEKAAVEALERAAAQVEANHGRLDVAWGEVHRLRSGDLDLPANGSSGGLGTFRVVNYRTDSDGKRRASSGDSFVAAVEFSDPPQAHALIGYGNASQPGSPHRHDQMELLSRQQLRPVWKTRSQIEANLSLRQTLK